MAYRVSKRGQEKAVKPKLKPSLPIMRAAKETKMPQITISTSNILRRKPMKEAYGKKHLRRRELPEPQHDLFLDYQDQVENSRTELLTSSHAVLKRTHSDLAASLAKLEMDDTVFYDDIESQRKCLLEPIEEETVVTDFIRDGKSVTETLQIGQRIEAFKTMLAKKESELAHYWDEWEKVQAKIVQLGIEVLGVETFEGGGAGDGAGDPKEKKGYLKRMGELDLEYQIWREEMDEEIKLIGEDSLRKMVETEKELSATLRKEKAILIARVFANND